MPNIGSTHRSANQLFALKNGSCSLIVAVAVMIVFEAPVSRLKALSAAMVTSHTELKVWYVLETSQG